jgi:lysophospholipase L1-like esterase
MKNELLLIRSARAAFLILFNLALLVLLWSITELLVRRFVDTSSSIFSKVEFVTMTSRDFIEGDSIRGFRLRPNYRGENLSTGKSGFRNPLPLDWQKHKIIFALGESTTFGWGLKDGQTYPAQLQERLKMLDPENDYVVVNAGVPSYSSEQVLLFLKELLDRYQPAAVLVGFVWNDIFYSSLQDWKPKFLVPHYPSKFKTYLYTNSAIFRFLSSRRPAEYTTNYSDPKAEVEFEKNSAELAELCRARGIPLYFVEPPFTKEQIDERGFTIWENTFSRDFLQDLGRKWATKQPLQAEKHQAFFIEHRLGVSRDAPKDLFLDPVHATAAGNSLVAEDIFRFLLSQHLFRPETEVASGREARLRPK